MTIRHIAIVGSRDYPDLDAVRRCVADIAEREPTAVVISGGARGVDTAAVDEARRLGLAVEVIAADWAQGRGAGFARNQIIVEHCTELVAFWDGQSKGTAHSIARARVAGKPVTIIQPDQEEM